MKSALIIVAPLGLILLGAACQKPATTDQTQQQNQTGQTGTQAQTNANANSTNPNEPDLVIKHLGVILGTYDPATGMAGDFKFTKSKLSQNRIWMDYGYVIPASQTSSGQDKANPQPTFLLPLGTKVHSLVDGVVTNVEKLYSNDYTVMVASSANSQWIYETEHVINPVVKVGDRVTAGQVVAEVSTWDSQNNSGLGMVEIGILHGGNPPEHVCPFAYLDTSVKADLQAKISGLYTAWETHKGDSSLYDEASMPVIGCQTLDPIQG